MENPGSRSLARSPSWSAPKSPSWIVERDSLRLWGDRKARAILAIFHARRCARKEEFFVHPDIAKRNGLTPSDLNWALNKLEGKLLETVKSQNGMYRVIRLLPQFEAVEDGPGEQSRQSGPRASYAVPEEERVQFSDEDILARVHSGKAGYLPEVVAVLQELAAAEPRGG